MLIKFLVSLQRKLRVRWTRKKNCLAIACTKLHSLTDHSIFFLLKFYLNMSCIWWQPDGEKEIKIVWFAKIWKPQRQDMALLRIGKIMAIRKNLAKFWKLGVALILHYLLTGFLLKQYQKKLWCDPGLYLIQKECDPRRAPYSFFVNDEHYHLLTTVGDILWLNGQCTGLWLQRSGFKTWLSQCVLFLGKKLCSPHASLHPGV